MSDKTKPLPSGFYSRQKQKTYFYKKNQKMKKDNLKNDTGVSQVDVNAKWECCKCGWVGKHSESSDKTLVINEMYLLVCPKCGNKDEFYAIR